MKIINLGILAHVDAGKTTLTESLLYTSGAICWRSPGRNGGMEQRHLPAFETGRAGKGQKLCAGYCPCGAGL